MTPSDFGPIYTETVDLTQFPVEPWNTYSNLIFLAVAIFIALKTRLKAKEFPLLVISLPVLLIGFAGGTIYHATRAHRIWLMMDYLPIMILCLFVAVYLVKHLTGKTIYALGIILTCFIFMRLIFFSTSLPIGLRITFGYSMLASIILIPAFLVSRYFPKHKIYLLRATLLFALAISFRFLDKMALLPMGTHFLWHVFGGLSVWSLVYFLIEVEYQTTIRTSPSFTST